MLNPHGTLDSFSDKAKEWAMRQFWNTFDSVDPQTKRHLIASMEVALYYNCTDNALVFRFAGDRREINPMGQLQIVGKRVVTIDECIDHTKKIIEFNKERLKRLSLIKDDTSDWLWISIKAVQEGLSGRTKELCYDVLASRYWKSPYAQAGVGTLGEAYDKKQGGTLLHDALKVHKIGPVKVMLLRQRLLDLGVPAEIVG